MQHLIGREEQQRALHVFLDGTAAGEGHIVFIAGEAGAGKTAFIEECLSERDIPFCTARGMAGETPSYNTIITAIRDGGRVTNGHSSSAVDSLLLQSEAPQNREAFQSALLDALAALTESGPFAVFLDDLQWVDTATLDLLPLLADRIRGIPLLLIGSYRDEETGRGHPMRRIRTELRRRHCLQEITLNALSKQDTAQLIERIAGGRPSLHFTDIVFEHTQGVPLFVEELTETLRSQNRLTDTGSTLDLLGGRDMPIPENIRDAVLIRLDVLTPEAREKLELAACAGKEFDTGILTELSDSVEGIDELFEQRLLREGDRNRAAFRHSMVRDAVYSEIPWSRKRELNRLIAGYLERRGAPPEIIADHLLAAHAFAPARSALLASAENSCRLHAYGDAARFASRALEIWPADEDEEQRLYALERYAYCSQVSGDFPSAVKALKELLHSPLVEADGARLGEVHRSLATVYGLQGQSEYFLAEREAAAEAFESANMPEEASVEWLAAASRETGMLHLETAVRFCDKALTLARSATNGEIEARILGLKGNILTMLGRPDEGMATVKAGLSLALDSNYHEAAAEVYRRLGSAYEYAGNYSDSKHAYSTAYNYCVTNGVDTQARICMGCMSYILFRTGDWKQCIEVCREIVKDTSSAPGSIAVAQGVMGHIHAYRGELRQARKHMQEAMDFAKRYDVHIMLLVGAWGRAMLEMFEGNEDRAEESYRALMDMWKGYDYAQDALIGFSYAVTFFARKGMHQETALCLDALSTFAAKSANPEAMGLLAFALGESAAMHGRYVEALEQFQRALELIAQVNTPVEQLRCEFRYGIAQVQAGNTNQGLELMERAYRTARNLGARQLTSIISAELAKHGTTGARPRSHSVPSPAGTEKLTRRQNEILRHIADGMTNREIAEKLFLSPRTVEMHVANMMDRLNVRSRTEAVHKAGELGLL